MGKLAEPNASLLSEEAQRMDVIKTSSSNLTIQKDQVAALIQLVQRTAVAMARRPSTGACRASSRGAAP